MNVKLQDSLELLPVDHRPGNEHDLGMEFPRATRAVKALGHTDGIDDRQRSCVDGQFFPSSLEELVDHEMKLSDGPGSTSAPFNTSAVTSSIPAMVMRMARTPCEKRTFQRTQ